MEKGKSRNSASSKTNNSESKAKQDVQNKYPKLPRFKEGISPRPETRRKPNPQRNRELFDKRPRNKTAAVCEKYRSEVAEVRVNDAVTKQGSKKINLNHLLDFTLTPIDHREAYNRRGAFNKTRLPKYNKELFLQANCQFVARDYGDYAVHEKNPDILVEWSLIEEIYLPSCEVLLCPICLYSPIAAKITRCGHIYCWPCILHYLALTDKSWQKCPICYDAVHKNDLKSISLRMQSVNHVGDEINMCLMKRDKGSLLPVPILYEDFNNCICSVRDDDSITRYQKLLLADKQYVQSIIKKERIQLQKAYDEEKDTPEACFIESALKLLEERENSLLNSASLEISPEKPELSNGNSLACAITESSRKHLQSTSSTDSHDEASFSNVSESSLDLSGMDQALVSDRTQDHANVTDKKSNTFFYQSEDGQHIYMHNINIRMLVKEYGALENSPPVIRARIVEIERVSMTDVLRKKFRYLRHLPLTCEFQIVELDFVPLLSKPVIQLFEGEIKKRRYYRNKKAHSERMREKYIEEEENKKLGKYPKATYNLQSAEQFPVFKPGDFQSLCPSTSENEHEISHTGLSNDALNSASDVVPVASFAQLLKECPKAFTETPKHAKAPTPIEVVHFEHNENSDDEYVPAPDYHLSFGDAIQAALDSVTIQDNPAETKSSKKKKGKKKLLFTTSMCRNK